MLAHKIWERIEIEHMMSWLSTLGGGFSALGDSFTNCVSKSHKSSVSSVLPGHQLNQAQTDT